MCHVFSMLKRLKNQTLQNVILNLRRLLMRLHVTSTAWSLHLNLDLMVASTSHCCLNLITSLRAGANKIFNCKDVRSRDIFAPTTGSTGKSSGTCFWFEKSFHMNLETLCCDLMSHSWVTLIFSCETHYSFTVKTNQA